jgi:hypothetical protein
MKLSLVFIFFCTSLFSQNNRLEGVWILNEIIAPTLITVDRNKSSHLKINSNENQIVETKQITLREYLLEEMQIGITKFLFNGNKFEFYRNSNLTSHGKFEFEEDLISLYINSSTNNKKEFKNVILNDKVMTFESISNGHTFTLSFVKSD